MVYPHKIEKNKLNRMTYQFTPIIWSSRYRGITAREPNINRNTNTVVSIVFKACGIKKGIRNRQYILKKYMT